MILWGCYIANKAIWREHWVVYVLYYNILVHFTAALRRNANIPTAPSRLHLHSHSSPKDNGIQGMDSEDLARRREPGVGDGYIAEDTIIKTGNRPLGTANMAIEQPLECTVNKFKLHCNFMCCSTRQQFQNQLLKRTTYLRVNYIDENDQWSRWLLSLSWHWMQTFHLVSIIFSWTWFEDNSLLQLHSRNFFHIVYY